MSKVSVVIPSWKGCHHLEQLVPTVEADEIIIVDAGSNDGTRELANRGGIRYLEIQENKGFAYAANAGIAAARHGTVAVLNNDLKLSRDWFGLLLPHLDSYPYAVGKLLQWETPDRLDGSWDALSLSGIPLRCGHGKPDGALFSCAREIPFAPWTAILLRREFWQTLGPLEDSFGSYFEDVDYGLRALASGQKGYYEPAAVAWHRGSASLGPWHPRQVELSARNQLLLVAKHGGKNWIERWPREFWVGQLLSGMAAAKHGQLPAWWRGKRAGWRVLKQSAEPLDESLAAKLEALQGELFELTQVGGADPFWRYYWALTL
ncbi:MAG: hypothetical protein OHK0021_14850 [Bryobacter sp.]